MVKIKINYSPLLVGEGLGRGQMKPRNIIIGQKVSPEKIKLAKKLRHNMTRAEKILW